LRGRSFADRDAAGGRMQKGGGLKKKKRSNQDYKRKGSKTALGVNGVGEQLSEKT